MTNDAIKCQQLFLNLLIANDSTSAYIREFLQTEQCDKVFDLSNERKSIEQFIGPGALERIKNYKEHEIDERIAHQAIIRHSHENKKKLLQGLNFKTKVIYYLDCAPSSGWQIAHNRPLK